MLKVSAKARLFAMQNILKKIKEVKEKIFKKEHLKKAQTFDYRSFFTTASYGRTVALIGITLLVLALPVTIFVMNKQTNIRQFARNACPIDDWTQCAGDNGLCTNINSKHLVHVYENSACTDTCIDQGESSQCGGCQNHTLYNQCSGQQTCNFNYNDCSSGHSYTNCHVVPGQCGAPNNCSDVGGGCFYNGCPGDYTSITGYCSSGYQQCCKQNPTPTPTPVPNYTCGKSSNKAFCTNRTLCNQNNDLTPADSNDPGYGTCSSSQICCKSYITPTPLPSINCEHPTDPNYKWPSGYNGAGLCAGNGNPSYPVCSSGKFYQGPSNCQANTICCEAGAAKHHFTCDMPGQPTTNNGFTDNSIAQHKYCAHTDMCVSSLENAADPCAPDYANCPQTISGTSSNGCQPLISAYAPHCPAPQYYQGSNVGTDLYTCIYKGPTKTCSDRGGVCPTSNTSPYCPSGYSLANASFPDTTCPSGGHSCCFKDGTTPAPTPTPTPGSTGGGGSSGGGSSGGGGGGGSNPTPTPSCTNGKATQFAMNIKLPGIGDSQFENHTPKHPTKHASIVVKDDSGNILHGQSHDFSHALSHANGNGKLGSERIDLASKLVCGKTYHVEVKLPGYVTVKKDIAYGDTAQTLDIAESDIIPGDIVGDGTSNYITPDNQIAGDDKVNLSDYNIFRQCHDDPGHTYEFKNNTADVAISCSDLINLYDFQDGGVGIDQNTGISEYAENYNLWLRGFLKFNGK